MADSTTSDRSLLHTSSLAQGSSRYRGSACVAGVDAANQAAGVNVLGHFTYPSGVGEAALSTVRALRSLGIPVACRDVPVETSIASSSSNAFSDDESYDISILHLQPGPLFDSSYQRAGLAPKPSTYRIGVWYWELDAAPAEWIRQSEMLDEVWAPTSFIAAALSRSATVPVIGMLPGVELPTFRTQPRERFALPADHCVFLFMFDMRSTMARKNPLGLVDAFRRAFRPNEKATLVIKVSRGECSPSDSEALKRAAADANIIIMNETMSRDDSYALIECCDCFVSLHRSEGLGLCLAEAMLMAKPVIATGYSGNLDFMTPDDSILVDYKTTELQRDILPYRKGNRWAEPNIDDAARAMRRVFADPEWAAELGVRGKKAIADRLSLRASAAAMKDRLSEIHRTILNGPRRSTRAFRYRPNFSMTPGSIADRWEKLARQVRYYGLANVSRRAAAECRNIATRLWSVRSRSAR